MTIVIVGAGLGGLRTAQELRKQGYDGGLVLVGDEPHLPYDRPPLSKEVIRGEREDTTFESEEYFAENRIELRLGVAAVRVDTENTTLELADGSTLPYDQLVIATGLRPRRVPLLPDLHGVHVLRSRDDAESLRRDASAAARAVVVGAGFVGCEVAAGLRHLGVDVTLVEPQATPLASVLGSEVGELVSRLHRDEGVTVRTGVGVDTLRGTDRVTHVVLSDGTEVEADLVVIGIGSTPVVEVLEASGVTVDNGIVADAYGRTDVLGVWAVGDVAAWDHPQHGRRRVEHWSNVGDQVRVMVPALLGKEPAAAPRPVVPYFWSDQYDVKIQALGSPSADDSVEIVEDDGRKFLAYYVRDGILTAVVGAGMAGAVMKMRAKIGQPT
ncbi:FAD-dependent oxidoreductase [Rhodococcus sp. 06-156-3C]|uniref:NAD(P)/FAD-dependent oxidoreductase n=1 Tax=Nocardiaceae TaxID=85025 RepID=UPI000522EEFE|nr:MULTISPECIES: FAD-dependent oxidoreductase [Rhodococcus]OZD14167.1 FAD-dependent oxidoreductase [Rhodococcus sp. 06-156-3C]OZD15858.1 FAD-dependent oxidoreductase [Rhodococcus sp. 06-156-4C]OZD24503.1 FAD-dependent oxidoreductase [Rhodococcus sp. 06-156-3b]OZD28457.1 FAD-dependent oxidoreductase [Rhodococcus sp. 06-156-4a]OZD36783.1 FAD-dependent oxidoreductase [Rhodococcus sp. 06-156-3]